MTFWKCDVAFNSAAFLAHAQYTVRANKYWHRVLGLGMGRAQAVVSDDMTQVNITKHVSIEIQSRDVIVTEQFSGQVDSVWFLGGIQDR